MRHILCFQEKTYCPIMDHSLGKKHCKLQSSSVQKSVSSYVLVNVFMNEIKQRKKILKNSFKKVMLKQENITAPL